MANTIHITERENRLFIEDLYTPIVCGNSNYELVFHFTSEEWKNASQKTALFLVDEKRTLEVFEGNICTVPVLPNGAYVMVSLMSANSQEEQIVTTKIRLRLEPNPFSEPYKKDEVLKRYASQIHGAVNEIKNGNIKVKFSESADFASLSNESNKSTISDYAVESQKASYAENSDHSNSANFANRSAVAEVSETQVDLTSNQNIEGTKNFIGTLQTQNHDVLNSTQVSNPNLLINGNFQINQREKTTYTTIGEYTVDRWRLESGSVSVAQNGIVLNGTIAQPLEFPPTQQTTLSVDTSNGEVIATYENGVVYLSASNVLIGWVKLECGTHATMFCPKPYAEELLLCQRYYVYMKKLCPTAFFNAAGGYKIYFSTPTTMRACSVKSATSTSAYLFGQSQYKAITSQNINYVVYSYNAGYVVISGNASSSNAASLFGVSTSSVYSLFSLDIELDGEIY